MLALTTHLDGETDRDDEVFVGDLRPGDQIVIDLGLDGSYTRTVDSVRQLVSGRWLVEYVRPCIPSSGVFGENDSVPRIPTATINHQEDTVNTTTGKRIVEQRLIDLWPGDVLSNGQVIREIEVLDSYIGTPEGLQVRVVFGQPGREDREEILPYDKVVPHWADVTDQSEYKLETFGPYDGPAGRTEASTYISADGSPWQIAVEGEQLRVILGDLAYTDLSLWEIVGRTPERVEQLGRDLSETGPLAAAEIGEILKAAQRLLRKSWSESPGQRMVVTSGRPTIAWVPELKEKLDAADEAALEADTRPSLKPEPGLSSLAFAYALAAQLSLKKEWAAGAAPDTFSKVRVLHRGCANEAAYWTFETSTGETYVVQVERRAS